MPNILTALHKYVATMGVTRATRANATRETGTVECTADCAETMRASISPEMLRQLGRVSRFRGTVTLFADWVIIAGTILAAGWVDHAFVYILAVFIVGNRQHAIIVLGHEGTHRLLTQPRWLNNFLTQMFCLWPVLTDMYSYRAFHFQHHRNLNAPEDPELGYRRNCAPAWDIPCSRRRHVLRFALDLLGFGALENLRLARHAFPKSPTTIVGFAAAHAAVATVMMLTGTLWALALWIIAMLTSFAGFMRFRMWLEHIGTSDTHRLHLNWWQSWLFAPHYSWLHWEHHQWPGIPCWNLLRARSLVQTVPAISLGALFTHYVSSPPVKSGEPIRAGLHQDSANPPSRDVLPSLSVATGLPSLAPASAGIRDTSIRKS